MNPPVEPSQSEALQHAVESLRRSDLALTAREILKAIPPPSRMAPEVLEQLLNQSAEVIRWPRRTAKASPRYWTRRPEDVAASLIAELAVDAELTARDFQKKASRPLAGFSAPERARLVESEVAALVAAGKLYVHPPATRGQAKYSARPAQAEAYVFKLRKELEALAERLAPAGITREQILDALASAPPAVPAPAPAPPPLAAQITEYLKSKPGGIGVGQLREDLGLSPADKPAFDETVVALYRQHRVYLDRHDWPAGLSQEARDELVTDGSGNYYVVIGLQDADAESIP